MKKINIQRAVDTLIIEAQAVKDQIKHLDDQFIKSVDLIEKTSGRVIVMGLGKSGLIGRKIAATMSSVGVPSMFLHPAECLHGDLGMIMKNDIVLMLSYSGETDEIKQVLPVLQRMKIKIIVMTGKIHSQVWKGCDLIINSEIKKEACPYNLAPTSSTSAMLALGDALALVVSERKGFKKENLALLHPLGAIGKKLTMDVAAIMRKGKANPVIKENSTVKEALLVMTGTRVGATSVVDKKGKLTGFFTDGDLRRQIQLYDNLLDKKITDVMTKNPVTVTSDMLAVAAAKLLQERNFDNIPVVDKDNKPVGILDERDLLSEGIE
ncbi:MAG: KpsF/GutQ family sugar-phosphate isomerase [Endomicrobiaceae bacterium]|jgi:arabinose-5-phosphate isomerase|nr:KpsF/GutQ family sugar-phosphate isomerase [Endomicrobiaceae bacterium]